jgi:hypothetical protein
VAAPQAVRPRIAVNLALLAALLLLGLLAWFRPLSQEKPASYRVTALEPTRVASIRLERPGQEAVDLKKNPGGWLMTAPWTARAHEPRAQRLLDIAALTSSQRFPARDLARFELDRPLATLVMNGEAVSIGALNHVTREQYLRAGEWVYLVDSRAVTDVFAPATRFLSPRLLGPEETPIAFHMDSVSIRQEQGTWRQSAPPGQPVSQDDFNRWVQEWRLATALEAQPAPAGGQDPGGELRISLMGGREIILRVLQREPQLVLVREDEGLAYRFPRDVGDRLLSPPR